MSHWNLWITFATKDGTRLLHVESSDATLTVFFFQCCSDVIVIELPIQQQPFAVSWWWIDGFAQMTAIWHLEQSEQTNIFNNVVDSSIFHILIASWLCYCLTVELRDNRSQVLLPSYFFVCHYQSCLLNSKLHSNLTRYFVIVTFCVACVFYWMVFILTWSFRGRRFQFLY